MGFLQMMCFLSSGSKVQTCTRLSTKSLNPPTRFVHCCRQKVQAAVRLPRALTLLGGHSDFLSSQLAVLLDLWSSLMDCATTAPLTSFTGLKIILSSPNKFDIRMVQT